jgi:WD40 repeat protein
MSRLPRPRRHSKGTVVHTLIGLFLLAGTAFTSAQEPPRSELEELRRQLQQERAARRALTYQADMRKAAQLAESQDWPALRGLLESYRPAPGEADLRRWEWHFLMSLVRKHELIDRQEAVFQGPATGIRQLAWSGDGARLAAVGGEGDVVLWDAKTGKELRRLGGQVRYMAWNRDGRRLTVSARNGTVSLWPGGPGPSLRFFGPVEGLRDDREPAFSPDGRLLALASDPTSAVVVPVEISRNTVRLAGHQGLVTAIAWHPESRWVATGSRDGKLRVWDPSTGKSAVTIDLGGDVQGLQYAADGQRLAAVVRSAGDERRVEIWDVDRATRLFSALSPGGPYRPDHRQATVLLSPDGKRIAAETLEGISVWETATARPLFQAQAGPRYAALDGCDPSVTRWASLQTVGTRATLRVLDLETRAEISRLDLEIPMNRYQAAMAWHPDGKRLAVGLSQGKVYVVGVPAGPGEVRIVNAGPSWLFAWGPDGRRFAFAAEGDVRLKSLPVSSPPPVRLGPPLALPSVVALSPDGKTLAGADRDGTLPLWDIATGQVARRLPGHPAPLGDKPGSGGREANALLWGPDGTRLATVRAGDGSLIVWDPKTGTAVTSWQFGGGGLSWLQNDAIPAAWSRDARYLAVRAGAPQRKIRVLDAATGKEVRSWDGGPDLGSSNAMAWDPAGRKLATCLGNPPKVQVWEAVTGKEVAKLDDEVPFLRAMSWSPDGRWLALGLHDRWRLHDVSAGRVTQLPEGGVLLAWSPDGSRAALIASGPSSVTMARVYNLSGGMGAGEELTARPDPEALQLPPGMGEPYNLRVQSVVWNERGIQAAGDAMPYPGMGMLVAWDLRSRKPLLRLGQVYDALAFQSRVARKLAWAPDGRQLATYSAAPASPGRVDLWAWAAADPRRVRSLDAPRVTIRDAADLAWSPDSKRLACATAAGLRIWTLARPEVPVTLKAARGSGQEPDQPFLAWSADGRSLALLECFHSSGNEAVVTAWDIETGKARFSWTRPYERSDLGAPLSWSPDGKRIAWGGPGAGVWDVAAGKEAFPLAGHAAPVSEVFWSPDGLRVISRCEVYGGFARNFELKVWDSASGQEILLLRGPMAGWLAAPGLHALASPPGRGSDPGDVLVWDLDDAGDRNAKLATDQYK